MTIDIDNIVRFILLCLIVVIVGVELGNPQQLSQQFSSLQASAQTPGIRPAKFRTRQAKTSLQRRSYGSQRQR